MGLHLEQVSRRGRDLWGCPSATPAQAGSPGAAPGGFGMSHRGRLQLSRALPPSWKEVLPHVGLELEVYFMAMALCPVIVTTEQSGTILLTIFSGLRKKFLDGNVFSSSLWGECGSPGTGAGTWRRE